MRKKVLALYLIGHIIPLSAMENLSRSYELLRAAEKGDELQVKFLLADNVLVNIRDKKGKTPLHRASYKGYEGIAKALLDHGAENNPQDKQGLTPLYHAARRGHVGLAKLLLEYKALVSTRTRKGDTVLHKAISKGIIELVDLLRTHQASFKDRDRHGNTPLHKAARKGHAHLAHTLVIQDGIEASIKNDRGYTPLHIATYKRQERFCNEFLKALIMKDIKDSFCEALPRILTILLCLDKSSLIPDLYPLILTADDSLIADLMSCAVMCRTGANSFDCILEGLIALDSVRHSFNISLSQAARILATLSQDMLLSIGRIKDTKGKRACDIINRAALMLLTNPDYLAENLESVITRWLTTDG